MFNQNGADMWKQMLTENFGVQDQNKLNWVSQYAAIHEIYESNLGVNGVAGYVPDAPGGVNPLYATPLNTTGMGNVMAPQNPNVASTAPAAPGNLWNQTVGSGDVPMSTLPMALNIALMTIGLELVPVIPTKGPWVFLSYMDFPYAGGKLGRANETAFDGKGEGRENKPIYIKVKGFTLAQLSEIRVKGIEAGKLVEGQEVTIGDFTGKFIGLGRMDACPLFEVVSVADDATDPNAPAAQSLREAFDKIKALPDFGFTFENAWEDDQKLGVDFVQTSVDLVDGFANFATGAKEAMTRAQNETGTGNVIGLRLFSKWVQVGSYEVTGTVTRQQLQDLPLYGVDAVGKVMEAMQNELTQHINQRILERVFMLGTQNAAQLKARQGVDLNLWLGTSAGPGVTWNAMTGQYVTTETQNVEVNTSAENLHTRQRRVATRILAAANLIQVYGRRGRPTWIVTNPQVATLLQDISSYVVAPAVNTMAQDGSQNLYMGGTLFGLKVYVDPYMDWNDTRICVGRKGDANSPGLVFLPYILADKVSITAEGTMAPKMLLNSRFALAEIGFYPESQYLTFNVGSEFLLY